MFDGPLAKSSYSQTLIKRQGARLSMCSKHPRTADTCLSSRGRPSGLGAPRIRPGCSAPSGPRCETTCTLSRHPAAPTCRHRCTDSSPPLAPRTPHSGTPPATSTPAAKSEACWVRQPRVGCRCEVLATVLQGAGKRVQQDCAGKQAAKISRVCRSVRHLEVFRADEHHR